MATSRRVSMPNRTESMQRLQFLSSQQEVLRRRIDLHIPASTPLTSASSETRSLASSPTSSRSNSAGSFPWSSESTQPVPTEPGTGPIHTLSPSHLEDHQKLCEVNQQIKATLTELLNTDSVRSDEQYRMWIQGRLMEVEQQIRKQRRRHSTGDREIADSIATHISPGFATRRGPRNRTTTTATSTGWHNDLPLA